MPYGLIPWGAGFWGLNVSPIPTPPAPSNIHIVNVSPGPGSFNIAINQTFTFTIKSQVVHQDGTVSPGFALNPNNTYIFLDNQFVVNGLTTSPNFAVVSSLDADGVSMNYQITPNYLFRDASVFTLQVRATDIYGNPSFPFWAGYVVVDTRPSLVTPIYPLDGYVNVPTDLTLHFLVNQLAAPNAGFIPSTLSVLVDNVPAVTNGIIQDPFNGMYSALNLPSPADITTPFEVVLDYAGRYPKNEIVIVSVSVDSIVVPVIDANATFLNQYGQNSGIPPFSITSISSLTNKLYSITLGFNSSGLIADGYQLNNSNGNTFLVTDIIDGYHINVQVLPKTFRDNFSFVTTEFDTSLTTPVFAGYFQGVYLVDNLGDGYHVNVTWHPARTTRPDYDLAYLIYYSTTRSDVFYEEPKIITQGRRLPPPETIAGADAQLYGFFAEIPLPVGVSYYFGVRATEYPHSTMPIVPPDGYGPLSAGLITVDGYSFAIPAPQVLMTAVTGSGNVNITVYSTAGFARAGGYITVGSEIMRYTNLTTTTVPPPYFIVMASGRGQFGTTIQNTHNVGEVVKMYYGNKDDNTVIAKNLVSWESPYDPHRTRPDLVTTDFTLEDGYNTGFDPFDYCGYHRFRPDELFSDTDNCGTYVGGQFGGQRGLLLFERMLANEEQLLEVTGEPAILLRRLWSGETCICRTSRKDSSKVRSCALCFGTGFKIGFVQYLNPRRADQRIMIHFAPSEEDLGMGAQSGWDQKFKPGTWTIAVPAIKDRDVIVRFNAFGEMDWIYVVNSVSRSKSIFGQYARQKMSLSRLDKTDIMYQFKIMK